MAGWSASGRPHGADQMTIKQGQAALRQLLVSCTDGRLAAFTPDRLANMHQVASKLEDRVRYCECELIVERNRRARLAAEMAG